MEGEGKVVPVVDLREGCFGEDTEEGRRLVAACEEWGCFRVLNHGVPEEVMREMKLAVEELFQAPEEVKRRNADVIAGSGYKPSTLLNPLYEAFGLYDASSPRAIDAFCQQLEATSHQREVMRTYARHMNRVALELASKIAQSLGLDVQKQQQQFGFEGWVSQFRINRYSFTERSIGSNGVCAHTDSSFLTILQEDPSISGLEVFNAAAGGFVPVDPIHPGSLLVNLGDIARVWSNGRFCNVKHRVECKSVGTRITIALFLLGPKEGTIDPPASLLVDNYPRIYKSFAYEDYRKLRISSNSHQGEILQLYQL